MVDGRLFCELAMISVIDFHALRLRVCGLGKMFRIPYKILLRNLKSKRLWKKLSQNHRKYSEISKSPRESVTLIAFYQPTSTLRHWKTIPYRDINIADWYGTAPVCAANADLILLLPNWNEECLFSLRSVLAILIVLTEDPEKSGCITWSLFAKSHWKHWIIRT